MRSWIRKRPMREYAFPQVEHTFGLSFEWVKWWLWRCPFVTKVLPHPSNLQTKGLSPVYGNWWSIGIEYYVNSNMSFEVTRFCKALSTLWIRTYVFALMRFWYYGVTKYDYQIKAFQGSWVLALFTTRSVNDNIIICKGGCLILSMRAIIQ